jgi:plasmid stabilization system protein ParE
MQIIRSNDYINRLLFILNYIAQDNKIASLNFKKEIDTHIENLILFPQIGKKSTYFDDENIRELMYKTYTVIYKTTHKNIIILDIFNQNQPIQK